MSLMTPLGAADLHHPGVDAAMATASDLLGMPAVFIGGLTAEEFAFERLYGDWPETSEGDRVARGDSFCALMLDGAPNHTADAVNDPVYGPIRSKTSLDITTYVGVPLETGDPGVAGSFCAIDARPIEVTESTMQILRDLAHVIEAHISPEAGPVIRRGDNGWRVAGHEEPDLISAMVMADLLSPPDAPTTVPPGARDQEGAAKLEATIHQLEHALGARVAVEQAIGIMAERHRLAPRAAFERLRRAARSRGRKVQELAREIIASTTEPVPLPPELARRH